MSTPMMIKFTGMTSNTRRGRFPTCPFCFTTVVVDTERSPRRSRLAQEALGGTNVIYQCKGGFGNPSLRGSRFVDAAITPSGKTPGRLVALFPLGLPKEPQCRRPNRKVC